MGQGAGSDDEGAGAGAQDRRVAALEIVDTHVQFWDPRLRRSPGPLTTIAGRIPGSKPMRGMVRPVAAAAANLFPSSWETAGAAYLPADYARDIGELPIRGMVLAGAGWHDPLPGLPGAIHGLLRELGGATALAPVPETQWLAGAAREAAAPVTALLVRADVSRPGLGAELDTQLAVSPLVRGVVMAAARHPDPGIPSFTHTYRILAQPAFLDGFAQIAARDLTFDVWVYSHDLPDVAELARRYPEVTIIVDHLATPAGVLGPAGRGTGLSEAERRGLLRAWSDDLEAVAQLPNTVIKISGTALPMLGHEPPLPGHSMPPAELAAQAGSLVKRALEVFGPDRTMWGSDMPMGKQIAGPQEIVSAITNVVAEHSDQALDAVFAGTARRVYGGAAGNVKGRTSVR